MEAQKLIELNPFLAADEGYASVKAMLSSASMLGAQHAEVERLLGEQGRELLRRLFEGHLELRGPGNVGPTLTDASGVVRTHRRVHERGLTSTFGPVRVVHMGYQLAKSNSLYPLDASLNLPRESYSHGMRLIVARQASKVSFDEVGRTVEHFTGVRIPHRQIEDLALRASVDFDAFYEERQRVGRVAANAPTATATAAADATAPIVVVTADGKGVVMRPEHLRDATRKAAAARTHKMATRLSPGEKRGAKRMAEVASVYTIAPFPRTPEQIVRVTSTLDDVNGGAVRPRPEHKRVWASLEHEPTQVIAEAFREAESRDPAHARRWVALLDGNASQIDAVVSSARAVGVELTIVLDVVHVIEYLWSAVTAFEAQGTPAAEAWVSERLLRILQGKACDVVAGMRRSATLRGLKGAARKAVDRCAGYLQRHARSIRYDEYLAAGLPIATGVIEGACRYLVKDRMDITGARWSLCGGEAVLRLRALQASGDFEAYWEYHLRREHERNHLVHYPESKAPSARPTPPPARAARPSYLRVVRGNEVN